MSASLYSRVFHDLALWYNKPACSIVVDDMHFDLAKIAVHVNSNYDHKLPVKKARRYDKALPLLPLTEFSHVMPELMFGAGRIEVPLDYLNALFDGCYMMIGGYAKRKPVIGIVKHVDASNFSSKNPAFTDAYCVLAEMELPEDLAAQHPCTSFYGVQDCVKPYKDEMLGKRWQLHMSRKFSLASLHSGNGEEELYFAMSAFALNPARSVIIAPHGVYGLVLEKGETRKYKFMKPQGGIKMRSALPPLPTTRRKQTLEEASKDSGLVGTAMEAAAAAAEPVKMTEHVVEVPKTVVEPQAASETPDVPQPKLQEVREPAPEPSEPATTEDVPAPAPKKRRRAAETDISGIDFEKLTATLNGAVPDALDIDGALNEIRNLRDLQLVVARRVANLAMKAITQTSADSKKLKQIMEAIGK